MAVILKLDTKPSLFEPSEVDIDGKLFKVRELTLGSLETIQQLQGDLNAGGASAIRGILGALLEGDLEVLKDLPFRKLQQLIQVLVEKALRPDEVEKNGPRPGGGPLPS